MKKTCENCLCSRVVYGLRTGWKYLYCMLDEPSIWKDGKEVSPNEDAVIARKNAEEKYFGEYSYKNSMNKGDNLNG